MSQETVKERRMAERGREKGRRTAADTEREELARSGTDRSGIPENGGPETAAGVTPCDWRAGSLKVPRKERKEWR